MIDKDVAALKDLIQIVYAVMDKLIEVYDNLAEENNARGTAIDENDKQMINPMIVIQQLDN